MWWLRGLMDKASDFGSEDCGFDSRRGRFFFSFLLFSFLLNPFVFTFLSVFSILNREKVNTLL